MLRIGIRPGQVLNWVRKFATLGFVKLPRPEKDLRDDVLIQTSLARRRKGDVLPLEPAGGVGHRAIFFREAGAGKPIDGRLDIFHFVRSDSWRLPEFAGLVFVDFADDQPVGLLQRLDIFLRVGTDGHSIHPECEETLYGSAKHAVPDLSP